MAHGILAGARPQLPFSRRHGRLAIDYLRPAPEFAGSRASASAPEKGELDQRRRRQGRREIPDRGLKQNGDILFFSCQFAGQGNFLQGKGHQAAVEASRRNRDDRENARKPLQRRALPGGASRPDFRESIRNPIRTLYAAFGLLDIRPSCFELLAFKGIASRRQRRPAESGYDLPGRILHPDPRRDNSRSIPHTRHGRFERFA